ncbi:AraC family transcriptional regulator [Arcobacter ellisii]|uniref:AraC family transcriptional regulator n=1 Tax=Arcobacter ellisii TaxID=913109 RepID=A0A347U8W0_9BACT|nr:AraC family transcriptional regulator [Arcobacter ellisii]AXX95288.1 transcriptional regulator, AraC family [Arcobacter ellisii]RXI29581.1 AraC family transcriptional regulator [Arcobacter ellisii]
MEKFEYKNALGITALKASMSKFSYKKHAHEEYAVGVTLRGIQEYNLDGVLQTSYKNGVMLFNPEQIHDGNAGHYKEGLDYVMLYIKPELFLEGLEKKDIVKFSNPVIYDEKIKYDILNLGSAILNQKDEAICSELYLNMIDNFSSKDFLNEYRNESEFIKKAKEIIYYELDDVLDIEMMSKEFNISKFQFIRMFKSNTGLSPYQYFLNTKLIHAKKYLDITKDLYGCVVEFGFTDLSHLNRHFKRVYGVTAFEYISK